VGMEEPDSADLHPLATSIEQLQAFSDEDIRGTSRLGSLSFTDAPEKVRRVTSILVDLSEEDWSELDEGFKGALVAQAATVVSTVDQMKALNASDPSAPVHRQNYEAQLNQLSEWFRATAQPRAFRARLRRELGATDPTRGDLEEADRLRVELSGLREQTETLRNELASLAPVVEASRAVAGASGAVDLATEYRDQADEHKRGWRAWRWVLLATGVVATVGSLLVVSIRHPSGKATSAPAVSRFLIDLLVIGLLLYAVRLASLQFRVHRHLEATDRSKAAALSTFARIVASGTEPSTRDVLAATLAQAVFTPGETGFIDAGSDHITLIERVVGPAIQKINP